MTQVPWDTPRLPRRLPIPPGAGPFIGLDPSGNIFLLGGDLVDDPELCGCCEDAIGPCCFADDSCADLTESDCNVQGGVWGGPSPPAVSCADDPDQCPRACCFDDGTCQELNPFECEDQGGIVQPAGSNCADIECPVNPLLCSFNINPCETEDWPCSPNVTTTTTGTIGYEICNFCAGGDFEFQLQFATPIPMHITGGVIHCQYVQSQEHNECENIDCQGDFQSTDKGYRQGIVEYDCISDPDTETGWYGRMDFFIGLRPLPDCGGLGPSCRITAFFFKYYPPDQIPCPPFVLPFIGYGCCEGNCNEEPCTGGATIRLRQVALTSMIVQ